MSPQSLGWLLILLVGGGLWMPPFPLGVLRTAVFFAALGALTFARELARLIVGTFLGLRATIVEIGEGRSVFRVRARGLLWHFKQLPIVSVTIWTPPPPAERAHLRTRLVLLALVRPALTLGVLLGLRALGVPLLSYGHEVKSGSLLRAVATAAEALLMISLFPFSLRGSSVVPFESDGLKLLRLPFAKDQDLDQELARYYAATAQEALADGDTARALAACREGLEKHGPPWADALRNLEMVVLSFAGDQRKALANAERDLGRDLAPIARSLALNNWSWFAFLQRDDATLRLADRRSADAAILQPEVAAVAGTRGAILLWQGRVAESLSLLERGRRGGRDARARGINTCLLAMAHAALGEAARAQAYLEEVRDPHKTQGLWPEAERAVRLAREPLRMLRASRGSRTLVLGRDFVELHQGGRVRHRLARSEIASVRVGLSARGRAQLLLVHGGASWRLPLDSGELTWARMSIGPPLPGTAADAAIDTQERAYQERIIGQRLAVSTTTGVLFLSSAVAFAASMLFFTTWKTLALIVPVLLLHELGHWIAMRAFGHDDARISFIPFLGAATFTKIPFKKRWQEVVMLLAGPVPGIVLGVALMVGPFAWGGLARSAAVMLLAINVVNLLPLHPLDGGRILHALVTAGRPRLDLAFKTLATLAFLGVGILMDEPVLTGLGVLGALFWRKAYRSTQLERRIRDMPGFAPGLPAKERRAYVFRALGEEPAGRAADWAATVAGLEMPLANSPPPLWQVMFLAGGFAICVLTTGALTMRSMRGLTKAAGCPAREQASAVSCADAPAFANTDWNALPAIKPPDRPLSVKANATAEGAPERRFGLGAFIWCSLPDAAIATELTQWLREAEAARDYCAALPWEVPRAGSAAIWRKARWTLVKMEDATDSGGPDALKDFDDAAAVARRSPEFDPEAARLLRETLSNDADEPIRAARASLTERLGRSPATCDRLVVENVNSPDVAGAGTGQIVRFSARMATAAELDALAGYLCKTGCRLQILPANTDDRRLHFCF
jgi:Zn-dependent protease